MTIQEVAKELEVSEKTVRRWIKNGELKASTNFVGRYHIERTDLDTFREAYKQKRTQK